MNKSKIYLSLIAIVLIIGTVTVGFAAWNTPEKNAPVEIPSGERIGISINSTSAAIFEDDTALLVPEGAGTLKPGIGAAALDSYNGAANAKMGCLKLKVTHKDLQYGITFSYDNLMVGDKALNPELFNIYILAGYSKNFDYFAYAKNNSVLRMKDNAYIDPYLMPHYLGATYDANAKKYNGGTSGDLVFAETMQPGEFQFTIIVKFAKHADDPAIDGALLAELPITFDLYVQANE